MALRVTFDLEERDLRYFKDNMKRARSVANTADAQKILARAEAMVDDVKNSNVPAFVLERVEKLNHLIDMVRDEEWALASPERRNVLAALAYFADPEDIIPDAVPVIGYIDDAIMIELVVRELKHEIEAFVDFEKYRSGEKARHRNENLSRDEYLEMKRRELHSRMRRRRKITRSGASGSTRTRFRLF
ncbi:MAG: YkvA family protein [Pseudomonadales bacterium]|jgi:uncharacterized membrane protein YkvA (DUF1232 family)|nr:YkvA family protein [Pseudomonadales bacterium]MDP6473058.1 YkvA family protein [Pseudomonadales bacterium]MDP6826185.1 YkvA family protein [Pseudomonadales bacterium]MDP6973438.1 YkvA family protein [Pseudomonadales bacterium]|tara:strand:+ start:215 stop:778 length:564 start_codon:yes stop_codon:yes gene_type:complete